MISFMDEERYKRKQDLYTRDLKFARHFKVNTLDEIRYEYFSTKFEFSMVYFSTLNALKK